MMAFMDYLSLLNLYRVIEDWGRTQLSFVTLDITGLEYVQSLIIVCFSWKLIGNFRHHSLMGGLKMFPLQMGYTKVLSHW